MNQSLPWIVLCSSVSKWLFGFFCVAASEICVTIGQKMGIRQDIPCFTSQERSAFQVYIVLIKDERIFGDGLSTQLSILFKRSQKAFVTFKKFNIICNYKRFYTLESIVFLENFLEIIIIILGMSCITHILDLMPSKYYFYIVHLFVENSKSIPYY